tara:strand:- start:2103 stop:2597 length:495 start_codon:yes stop_codon:yes gene_type:complete
MMDKSYVTGMWEDSIANSVTGGAIAGLPPDQPPVYLKKKKKYDGRHKDVREFVNKLLKKREQRKTRKNKKDCHVCTATLDEELTSLQESGGKVIDQLKKIAMSGGTGNVKFDDGSGQPVEPSEAGKIVNLYQNLNASNRVKMIKSINSSTNAYEKVKAFAQSRT